MLWGNNDYEILCCLLLEDTASDHVVSWVGGCYARCRGVPGEYTYMMRLSYIGQLPQPRTVHTRIYTGVILITEVAETKYTRLICRQVLYNLRKFFHVHKTHLTL